MSKHTPGPWTIWDEGIEIEIHERDDSTVIATVWPFLEDLRSEFVANARLIAAAPELLEACKQTLIDLRVARILSEKGFDLAIERLQAAIAKAEAQEAVRP